MIQRSWWKKGVAGLAAVGGGVAAGLGGAALLGAGVAMAPALALGLTIGGGLSLLGGAGYLGYQALKSKKRRAPAELMALRREQARLADARPGSRQALLHAITTEALGHLERGTARISNEPSRQGGGDTGRVDGERGRYVVRLDPAEQDPVMRQAYLLHELTHVSADTSYSANALRGKEFYNIPAPEDSGDWDAHQQRYGDQIFQSANELWTVADTDPRLSREQREHIQTRIRYLALSEERSRVRELDTVATDLLYYAHKTGVHEDSETHLGIQKWAREAYERRQAARRT